jgi:hypothetical protein
MVSTTPAGMEYSPTTGSYVSDGSSAGDVLGGNLIETTPSGINVYSPTEGTLRPFGENTGSEKTFMDDLVSSITDPNYDPEGTVLSRARGGLLTPSTSTTPTAPQTQGEFVQAASSTGLTPTQAAIAYEESRQPSSASERRDLEDAAQRQSAEELAIQKMKENPDAYRRKGIRSTSL